MTFRLLDAEKEPVFANLVTDPRFAQVANELLQRESYSAAHYTGRVPTHPEECNGCAPHRIEFLASRANRAHMHSQPRKIVDVSTAAVKTSNERRETAREFGPPARPGKRRKKGVQTDGE